MKVIQINNAKDNVNDTVVINGWVYNSRRSGKIGFLSIRDGFAVMQCIVEKKTVGDKMFDMFKSLTQESSISVTGKIVENERAIGGYELLLSDLEVHQLSTDYPITPKEHGPDFLMNNRHLWLRSKRQHAILKVRHEIIKSIRSFFDNKSDNGNPTYPKPITEMHNFLELIFFKIFFL